MKIVKRSSKELELLTSSEVELMETGYFRSIGELEDMKLLTSSEVELMETRLRVLVESNSASSDFLGS